MRLSFTSSTAWLSLIPTVLALSLPAHAGFTRLEPLQSPQVTRSAEAYPGGNHNVTNLTDSDPSTEYSSNNKGTNTIVEFDFGSAKAISAFRHVDRNDPATIAASELIFTDAAGNVVATKAIRHVNQRAGVTFVRFDSPVTSQRAKWRVTGLGNQHGTVGGAAITFFTNGQTETVPSAISMQVRQPQIVTREGDELRQSLKIDLDYPYLEPTKGLVSVSGTPPRTLDLGYGSQSVEIPMPAITAAVTKTVEIEAAGQKVASLQVTVKPVRKYEIFLLPHSHVDIGYTALQADVEKKQNENLEIGLRLAEASATNPAGSRFKWNAEVLWPVDNYLRTSTPEKRDAFIAAVRSGKVGLDAFYGNILTGLCRPEELIRLMSYATRLSEICGVPVESAMISDVPGYTWSTVSAMAQAGVKYFSFAPNYFDRMGGTMKEWQNKPFWWRGPDGKQRVLCWCPSRGYALGHIIGEGEALARFMPDYLTELESTGYPYEISHLRWNVHGDNGSPDEKLADVVRNWNATHVYPRLTIATTAEAFRAFEARYGNQLPEYSGDYTPYWEDGAASSAVETAMNRATGERLVQAETLWTLRNPGPFPAKDFQEAWKNVLLYSEHTWGAHNSISEPDLAFVRDQWKVKRGFAVDADRKSRELLQKATGVLAQQTGALEVFNTSSWERTDLVTVVPELAGAGDRVLDDSGKAVASQRLSTGELVFLAKKVPAFGSRVYRVEAGKPTKSSSIKVEGLHLVHPEFTVTIDENTGAISSLVSKKRELVDKTAATALNDYFYLPGADVKKVQRNGKPKITVKESGPLVASLRIESEAPGCKRLVREVRVVEGLDRIEIINLIDKLPVRAKEGLHFGYGFSIPKGEVRMDVGLAQVRPEVDQIPAACKNWFSVQRWVDIANDDYGVTWCPVDAPLVELGGLTANLIGSQTDWRVWIQHLEPTQTLYSWVMNNHWHTNYRADQEGPTVFRFAIRPHGKFAAEEAAKFGVACSQPLIVTRAAGKLKETPRLKLSSDKVLVSALKPSDDGKGTIVRLFGASGKDQKVKLEWSKPAPTRIWLSDTSERAKTPASNIVEVPGWGVVTLRAE